MDEDTIVERLLKRAEIRRQIPTRKSVQEGKADRIADLLEEAAAIIKQYQQRTIIDEIEDLNNIVRDYHNRNGTFNYHYDKMELHQWDVYWKKELTEAQWEALDVEDWVVRIVWSDNSNSTDVYTVPLKEILEWNVARKCKQLIQENA